MNLHDLLQKIPIKKPAVRFSRENALAVLLWTIVAATILVLMIDGYIFYQTVIRTRETPMLQKKPTFPEREAEELMQILDRRQNEFLKILGE